MDTPFENLDRDAREAWRGDPVTQAFLKTISDHRDRTRTGVIYTVQSGAAALPNITLAGGELKSLDFVLDLATREGR